MLFPCFDLYNFTLGPATRRLGVLLALARSSAQSLSLSLSLLRRGLARAHFRRFIASDFFLTRRGRSFALVSIFFYSNPRIGFSAGYLMGGDSLSTFGKVRTFFRR